MNDDTELKNIKSELQNYIEENYIEDVEDFAYSEPPPADRSFMGGVLLYALPQINFQQMLDEEKGETFSEMLLRLIRDSGEKNSNVYKRANIDRRHFSKIAGNANYRPSKETALAFAIALHLDFDTTQEFLATAGYTLTKNNLADVIITFFIERKIFDINLVNEYLYEYKQPLLGG